MSVVLVRLEMRWSVSFRNAYLEAAVPPSDEIGLHISPPDDVLNHHRKIKPTYQEKLVFCDGAGDTFLAVVQTPLDIGRAHIAAWPVQPGKETQGYPDPATNVAECAAELLSRA
ncbi:hypothetical protein AURDEDRAFT_159630 [Auricularia subglabra TFB-10046 SS5]|nr:hypothetical protein AURDEDRAFT_159630 [Auricularia subglabra TFB-10046 SS5]